jgi:TetR/AcrR family transcriptional regulator, cholesterol catabolism regulator
MRKKGIQKDDILKIATKLFLEKGYDGTSTADVCAAAGISKPTLYYYFTNKRHLFFSCHIRTIVRDLRPYCEKATAIKDPKERLAFMIKEFTRMICLNPELKVFIHETMSIRDEYFDEIRKEWKKHYFLLCDTIQEVQSSGKILSKIKPSRAALFLLGMMTWVTFWFDHSRRDQIDSIAEAAVYQGFYGLFGKE